MLDIVYIKYIYLLFLLVSHLCQIYLKFNLYYKKFSHFCQFKHKLILEKKFKSINFYVLNNSSLYSLCKIW